MHRIVTLDGSGDFLEKLVASEPGLSYTYSIIEAPLPISKYAGTVSITRGSPVEVTYLSRFSSDNPEMEAAVGDFYDANLAELQARFAD